MTESKRSVSLVLGSGGARGLAHIGVIKYLVEQGYDIRSISGSSIGALIGGIYATGKLDVYESWVKALQRMDVVRILDFSYTSAGLFKGERLMNKLKDLIGDQNIEDLPISYTAVATDIDAQKEVWISEGLLFDAIRASIAIPTVFTPFVKNGRRLLDGGLVNPIPMAPSLNDATDITIAVNLSAKYERGLTPGEKKIPQKSNKDGKNGKNKISQSIAAFIEDIQEKFVPDKSSNLGLFDVLSASLDVMGNGIAKLKLAAYSPDIIIEIPGNLCSFYEFHRAEELIEFGYSRAESTLRNNGRR